MASVKQLILNNLATTLEGITIANGYNTTIKKVIKGKILSLEKLPITDWRDAVCMIRYIGQRNEREAGLGDGTGFAAEARYLCFAGMSNATAAQMMNFLDDIEASISKDVSRGDLDDTAYHVIDTYIDNIEVVGSEEWDEVLDETSEQIKDQKCLLTIIVEYFYIPELLSGN